MGVIFDSNIATYMGGAAQILFDFDPTLFPALTLVGNQAARGQDFSTERPVGVYLRVYQPLVDIPITESTNLTEWVMNKSRTVSVKLDFFDVLGSD